MENGSVERSSSWRRAIDSLRNVASQRSQCWRPKTLQPQVLGAIACLMLAMLGVLEGLRQYSEWHGGLVFFSSVEEITPLQKFAYTYVPTIVAVLLIQVWSVVDFDVLRLEPYYQLSRPEGAPANILFLNYNFGQKTLAPFRAAKHGHWTVFWISLVTFAIRMGLLPLQTMVFGLHYVPNLEYEELETWPTLIDLESQREYILTQGNGMAAFTSDSRLPLSMSPDFGVPWVPIPFRREGDTTPWKMNHTVYWSEHVCRNIPLDENISPSMEIRDLPGGARAVRWARSGIDLNGEVGDGKLHIPNCTLGLQYETVITRDTEYFQTRAWETSYVDGQIFKASSGCKQPDLYALLLNVNMSDLSVSSGGHSPSASVFACDVSYHMGEANIQIYPRNNSLVIDHIYQERSHVMTELEFNIKAFQDLLTSLSTYLSDTLHLHKGGSRSRTKPLSRNGTVPQISPPLLQNAMDLISEEEFEYKITRAINSTFLLSIEQLFDNWLDPTYVTASRPSERIALTVVPFAAMWSELFLGAAAVAALLLIVLYQRRESFLRCDPDSVGAMCSITADIIHPDNILADRSLGFDRFSTRQLHHTFKEAQCHWRIDESGSRLNIVPNEGITRSLVNLRTTTNQVPGSNFEAAKDVAVRQDPRPHFLVLHLVFVEILAICSILVLLGLGVKAAHKHGRYIHGLGSHHSSLHTILHLVPAVIASSMNSLFTSMLRHMSLMEPWLFLTRGASAVALSLNYAPQSPFSTLYKAVRDRRLILGAVSLAACVTLVLMVLAAGVFHQSTITTTVPTLDLSESFSQRILQKADIADEYFHYDLVRTSISGGILTLPWTTQSHALIPLHIQRKSKPDAVYQAATLGVETHLQCHHIPTNTSLFWNETEGQLHWRYQNPSNPTSHCIVPLPWGLDGRDDVTEEAIYFLPPFDDGNSTMCESSIFVMSEQADPDDDYEILPLAADYIGIHCEPDFTIQKFNTTFNHKGDIQQSLPIKNTVIREGSLHENVSTSISHFTKFVTGAYFGPASEVPFAEWEEVRYDGFDEWAGYIADDLYLELYPNWDPLTPTRLSKLVESLYQLNYNTYFSASRDIYLQSHQNPFPPVKHAFEMKDVWSIIFSLPVLFIALVLISFDISVILLVFSHGKIDSKGPGSRDLLALRFLGSYTVAYCKIFATPIRSQALSVKLTWRR
ncbi:hypothetical protein N7470_006662 [Penicillium chermesinum]|nr:hypothetical protein N7470_006662 [Penicillium chermesinum]